MNMETKLDTLIKTKQSYKFCPSNIFRNAVAIKERINMKKTKPVFGQKMALKVIFTHFLEYIC